MRKTYQQPEMVEWTVCPLTVLASSGTSNSHKEIRGELYDEIEVREDEFCLYPE